MNKPKNDFFDKYDSAIISSIKMAEPNEIIQIYSGEYKITDTIYSIDINGKIFFDWFPSPKVVFTGIIKESFKESFSHFNSDGLIKIKVNELEFGEGFLTNIIFKNEIEITGQIQGKAIIGDRTIKTTKIIFSVPNLNGYIGLPIKWGNESHGGTVLKGRIILENEEFSIKLDKVKEFDDLDTNLYKSGGYVILYNGELQSKKGDISYDSLNNIITCLSTFLSFLNGRRCAPLFIQGIFEGNPLWTDFTSYHTDQYKNVFCWSNRMSIRGYNEAWVAFYNLWKNENDKDFLIKVIHWYIEANLNSGFLEGSIIKAQIALELFYNWLIIEKLKLIKGKDCENISASNKIRLLLSQINTSSYITNLKNLELFISDNQQIEDEIEAFVQIRNAIVHSQENKRKELTKINTRVKYEVLQLGLLYIEQSLLHILEFKESFNHRCSGKIWIGDNLESLTGQLFS